MIDVVTSNIERRYLFENFIEEVNKITAKKICLIPIYIQS